MHIGRGGDAHAALQHRAEVGDDVAEEVRGHRDVNRRRILDHAHARRVDVEVRGLDLGELRGEVGEDARVQRLRAYRVGLVDQGQVATRTLHRALEGVTDDALGALPGVEHGLRGDFLLGTLSLVLRLLHVGVLGILAHNEHVDVRRPLVLERAETRVEQLDRAQVDPQVEVPAQAADDAALHQADRGARVADGTEQDRVHALDCGEGLVRQDLFGLEPVVGRVGILGQVEAEAEALGRSAQDLEALGNHLGPDAVAGDHRDAMRVHWLIVGAPDAPPTGGPKSSVPGA